MAKAIYRQKGETLDYIPDANQQAGDIVSLGTRVGVIGEDVQAGQLGHVHVEGVYQMPKDTAAITLGATVYFNAGTGVVTATAAGNVPAGYAVAEAAASDTAALVKLLG